MLQESVSPKSPQKAKVSSPHISWGGVREDDILLAGHSCLSYLHGCIHYQADGSVPRTHALTSLLGTGITLLPRNPQDVFDLLQQWVGVPPSRRLLQLFGGPGSLGRISVDSSDWMSTASAPAAARTREGAIRCNPFPKIGVPDT